MEPRSDPPVGGEYLLCVLRFISVVEDKLPEVVITIQSELGEFNHNAAWLETDYFSTSFDDQFVFE